MKQFSPTLILASALFLLPQLTHAANDALGQEIAQDSDEISPPEQNWPYDADLTKEQPSAEAHAAEVIPIEDPLGSENIPPLTEVAPEELDVINVGSEDLWQRIKKGYAMPTSKSKLVANHERFFSAKPEYVQRMVERSQKYLFHIVEEVEKRGMPTEIALLPMIESAYNPQAYSRSRASGIWQFMPATGKFFGLKQNWWVDNRRDITIATDAALTYLQKLYAMFGSWDLALAAYNAGEGTVSRAIEQNRKLGLSTNYESLNLPAETKNYVPKLQAMKNLMTYPGKYGLQIQTIANTAYFTRVSAPPQIDAHLAAKLAEIPDEEFSALNPSYNRPVIAGHDSNHEILLPIASAQTFRDNLAAYNKPLVTWRTYTAKRGERIDSIASKFGVDASKIRSANKLSSQDKLTKSATIFVPNSATATETSPKKMESIEQIIEEHSDISVQQNAGNIDLAHTEKLFSAENDNDTVPAKEKQQKIEPVRMSSVTHTIKKGETLQSIARKYDVSVKQILAANTLKSTKVKVGQTITIKKEVDDNESSQAEIKNKKQDKLKDKKQTKNKSVKSKDKNSNSKVKQAKVKQGKSKQDKSKTVKTKTKAKKK
ncbi:MAG TPA: transglycosylase SLT domain-containing protein [Methylotenera sp.]|nr:transglycosylase SLT domain-containing protein [Methylotenera sp.]HPH04483.1 transglycosylase SLT domain-containing protein [Methylotenera sp.]HPN00888.1 transglycosylase SLT domain-containing protein [Methylotenera sp.]